MSIKQIIKRVVEAQSKEDEVAVLLSGGVDSLSVDQQTDIQKDLEILVEDLIAEIEDLSDSYGFSIDGGDCNYRYMKKEYKLLKEKEIK